MTCNAGNAASCRSRAGGSVLPKLRCSPLPISGPFSSSVAVRLTFYLDILSDPQ